MRIDRDSEEAEAIDTLRNLIETGTSKVRFDGTGFVIEAEAEAEDQASDEQTEAVATLTTEQTDAVDMLRGRINSALVGFDADSQLTILETVREVLNREIDRVIGELVEDDESDESAEDDETEDDHKHVWGPLQQARMTGTTYRECQTEGCRVINALDDVTEDDEYEPQSLCPACGSPIDYCQGHGELGDPAGYAILQAHDSGDHSQCAVEADCLGLAD